MSASNILAAVYSWLAADTGTGGFAHATTGIGSNLFHLSGPEDTSLPVCVYTLAPAAGRVKNADGTYAEKWAMSFSIWVSAESSDDAAALGLDAKLYARMNNQTLSATNYDRLRVICTRPGFAQIDEDTIRVDSEYEIRGQLVS